MVDWHQSDIVACQICSHGRLAALFIQAIALVPADISRSAERGRVGHGRQGSPVKKQRVLEGPDRQRSSVFCARAQFA